MSFSAVIWCIVGLATTFMFFIGGLLNLGGCGDRIGEKYYISNCLQLTFGLLGFIGIVGYMIYV